MNASDRYLKFVPWSEEDSLCMGYCPDLFPWGGVCHGPTEEGTYHQLAELVREEVVQKMSALAEQYRDELGDLIAQRKGAGVRGPGRGTVEPK